MSESETVGMNEKPWIERILQTGIEDFRKAILFWVLVPYLVTDKKIQYMYTIHEILDEWLEKCHEMRRLEPLKRDFHRRIDDDIEWATERHQYPTKEGVFKELYPDIYKVLKLTGGAN